MPPQECLRRCEIFTLVFFLNLQTIDSTTLTIEKAEFSIPGDMPVPCSQYECCVLKENLLATSCFGLKDSNLRIGLCQATCRSDQTSLSSSKGCNNFQACCSYSESHLNDKIVGWLWLFFKLEINRSKSFFHSVCNVILSDDVGSIWFVIG